MNKLAEFFSVVLHPLFLLNFALFSLLRFHPYYLSKFYENQFYSISLFIAVNTLIMPLLSVYLLKKFGFIDDFRISNPKQRLIPYSILVVLLVFTMYQLYKIDIKGLPLVFLAGTALCLVFNILINLKFTISSHGIAAGGLMALYLYLSLVKDVADFNLLLMLAVLVAGISAWSRLKLNSHTEKQVYSGILLGLLTVLGTCLGFM